MRYSLLTIGMLVLFGSVIVVQPVLAAHCVAPSVAIDPSHITTPEAANTCVSPSAAVPSAPSTAPSTTPSATALNNPLGVNSVPQLIGNIIKALFGIVGSIALLMFIWGGFTWMTAQGDPKRVQKGKDTLIWAVLGLAVVFGSYALVTLVINALAGSAAP
jgi:hypothetical protein